MNERLIALILYVSCLALIVLVPASGHPALAIVKNQNVVQGAAQVDAATWDFIIFEAEEYDSKSGDWVLENTTPGYSGEGYMKSGTEGEVHYVINFDEARRYYIYFKTYTPDHLSNGVHLLVDYTSISEVGNIRGIYFTKVPYFKWEGQFQYTDNTHQGPVYFDISSTGNHTVKLKKRESGFKVDKLIISKNKIGPDSYSDTIDQWPFENLPVELASFSVHAVKNRVMVQWTTKSETNNYGFEIERGVDESWEKVGFVKGMGTSTQPQLYEYIDILENDYLKHNAIRYRLKQIDTDGSFTYSHEKSVTLQTPARFSLEPNYPNPFNPTTTISYEIQEKIAVNISVYNSAGQLVQELLSGEKDAGYYSLEWDAGAIPAGMYIIRMRCGALEQSCKCLLVK